MAKEFPGTWRGSPFTPGHLYRAIALPRTWTNQFKVGDEVRYLGAGYDLHENFSVYVFVDAANVERRWQLMDDEPDDRWREVFAPVDGAA
jgi:hypothetical protein